MKTLALALGTLATALAPAALAQDYSRDWRDERRRDTARVIESRPLHARETRQECWNPRYDRFEEVREENRSRIGKGAAIGAVAGGVLGHQVDSGGGTAAGAVLGGILGHQLETRRDARSDDDLDYTRCRTASDGSGGVDGYAVRYEYGGREYVTRMSHDPGNRLRLGRDVNEDGTPFDNIAWASESPDYSWR